MKPFASKVFIASFISAVLALYSVHGVSTATEIAYDDGTPETTSSLDIGMHLAVKFSLPSGLSRAKLLMARIYKAGRSGVNMRVHILGGDGMTMLSVPFNFSLAVEGAWNNVDVSARNIVVSYVFYITLEYLLYYDPLIGRDTTNPRNRSYYGRLGSWSLVSNGENVMIRAVVEPLITVSSTVTGTPVAENILVVLAPYLFSACAVSLILTALAVRRSRKISQIPISH